jgi:membrane protein YdbS with pleckstrin-like domain
VVEGLTPDAVPLPAASIRQLHERSVLLWQVENAVGVVVLLVVAAVLPHAQLVPPGWDRWARLLVVAALVLSLLEAVLVIPRRYRFYTYALTSDSIIVEQGHLWRRRQVYPFSRILYCETRQGPILGLFNLFTVRAATIVDSRSIGPLSKAEADRFEQSIREHPK